MKTFNSATMTITPRVWIGCLHCYNSGELVGQWYDAVDAGDVRPHHLHGVPCSDAHEEMWVMDHENMPIRGEIDPYHAGLWGQAIEAIAPQWRAPYLAWIEDQWIQDPQDAPTQQQFNEVFEGQFESFRDYAEMVAGDIDLLYGAPDVAVTYFDWESYARDLEADYTVIDTPDYDVWVFHNH